MQETPPTPNPVDITSYLDPTGGAIATIIALLRLLATPPDAPSRPARAYEHPAEAAKQTFQGIYWVLADLGTGSPLAYLGAFLCALVVLLGGALGEVAFWMVRNVLPEIAIAGLDFIDIFRKTLDPQVAGISAAVLNELLGTDFSEEDMPGGEDIEAHLARAQKIGGLFHEQLMTQFQNTDAVAAQDGVVGAERFTGMIINFGVATALLGLAGEMGTGGFIKNWRLIGEQVSGGLGLSRLHRMAMKPLMNTLIATPYQWFLNQRFHPTQFKEHELVSPLQQTMMGHDTIFKAMDLLGYSNDKIEELIKLHEKRLTFDEIELLFRWQIMDEPTARDAVIALGYPAEKNNLLFYLRDLQGADAALKSLVDVAEASVADGHSTIEDFSSLLDSLPIGAVTKRFRLQAVAYKAKAPHAHLTTAQAQKAFDEGVWTLDELTTYFTARGYSADDNATLQVLTLLALAKIEDAAKVKKARLDAKCAAAKKKGLPPPPGC